MDILIRQIMKESFDPIGVAPPARFRVHHDVGRGHAARSLAHAACHDGLLFVRFLRDTKLKLRKKTWEQKSSIERDRG